MRKFLFILTVVGFMSSNQFAFAQEKEQIKEAVSDENTKPIEFNLHEDEFLKMIEMNKDYAVEKDDGTGRAPSGTNCGVQVGSTIYYFPPGTVINSDGLSVTCGTWGWHMNGCYYSVPVLGGSNTFICA